MRALVVVVIVACGDTPATTPPPTIECGAGTTEQNHVCVPVGLTCGAGTHDEDGTCVPDVEAETQLDIRTSSNVRADGWTSIEVTVVGTNADGTANHDDVVVTSERTTAGRIVSPRLRLGDRGAGTNFIPCNSVDPACIGTARISVAFASTPQIPRAHVDVTLVAPPAIGSVAPCLVGGNVLHFEAQDFGISGTRTITANGVFDVSGADDRGRVQVVADNTSFALELNTRQLGIPLLPSVYENARGIGRAAPGDPTFDSGFQPCTPISAFQIHAFTYDPTIDDVTEITASFTQFCPQTQPPRTLTGCVHFSQ